MGHTADCLCAQAYTPEPPVPGRFSIGARRSTSIEQEASSAAYLPGPGQYKNEARWDHVGSVKLGATAGREKPTTSLLQAPGPGVRALFVAYLLAAAAYLSCFFAGLLDAVDAV